MCRAPRRLALLAATALLAGCANGTIAEPYDPFEPVNRSVHAFNKGVDTVVLRPIASFAYKELVPELARHLIVNALDYLSTPVSFANATLQGNAERASHIGKRFFVNTTIGGLGLLDPATEIGLPSLDEDFGQTLAVWGVNSGPYLTLPLLGPTTPRDIVGTVVDRAFKPSTYLGYIDGVPDYTPYVGRALGTIEFRAANTAIIDDALYNSGDSYAIRRSIFLQQRANDIANGGPSVESEPDIFDDAY